MKQRVLRVVVFLLLGAVLNVAVAWGCASWSTMYMRERTKDESLAAGVGLTMRQDITTLEPNPDLGFELHPYSYPYILHRTEFRAGYPFRSCRGEVGADSTPSGAIDLAHLVPWTKPGRVIPYHPIWSGFTSNTLSYGAILWLLIRGPYVLRRYVRVRRHLCPVCGYPVGVSAVCTECGGAVLPRV